MALQDESPSYAETQRQSSVGASAELSSEDDAAVLGKIDGVQANQSIILDRCCSKAWVQARITPELHPDRGLRHRILHYGSSAFDCVNAGILDTSGACGHGLGAPLHDIPL